MGRVHIFADESGNFDFSRGRGASRYFILTAVTLRDCLTVNTQFLQLRHQMAWEGHDHPGPFHASTDPAPVRDRVFGIIEAQDVRVDALIVEKAKAMPKIRSSEESFYQHAWFYLMSYVAPRLACTEMLVVSSSLGGRKKKRQAFYDTVRSVMNQVSRRTYKTACWDATSDACLQVADYCGWAIQRKWESSDPAPYQRIAGKIRSEYDLFARGKIFYY
jgi:Protein of unknown function (DUF3800)